MAANNRRNGGKEKTKQMIYTREWLENCADDINRQYFPERLYFPSSLDAYDLAEAIGCDVEWKYISPDDSILGMTFFGDGYWPIWPTGTYKKGDFPQNELFSKGTVVINQRLLDSKSKTALSYERFVVAHECSHWIKDREYFEKSGASIIQTCFKNDFNPTYWRQSMNELEIIERQANYLCAAILMPRDVICDAFFQAGRYKHIPDEAIDYKPYMRAWIAKLSQEFGVNFNPVKYRLKDLNIITE